MAPRPKVYIIGSLRNPAIPDVANQVAAAGYDAFADWFGAGERADDAWREYEKARGRTMFEALNGPAARHVFEFDYTHLVTSDAAVLVMPAGKSAHLELGFARGRGIPGYVLFDREPERWDVMYQFATGVCVGIPALISALNSRCKR